MAQVNPGQQSKPRILVIYQYVALYRVPVFTELARSDQFQFTFMSGVSGRGETPKIADRKTLECADFAWVPTENCWFPGGLLWQRGVLRAAVSRDYDGIIFLGDMHYISTWLAAAIMKMLGRPAAFWTIGMHRPESGAKLAIRNFWHSLPGRIMVYARYARDIMVEGGVPAERVAVIGNSLDFERQTELFHALHAQPPAVADRPLLVAIGRLTPRRKLERLVEAVALLRASGLETRVWLIGQGPERDNLKRRAAELGVQDVVEFLGPLYDEETIAHHLYQADICVVPGIIGLGAVHAHSYGVPVITCGDWALQAPEGEVIAEGVTGAFCRWDDAESVAHEIRSWLKAGHARDQVRQACRARVADGWTPKSQRRAIEDALTPLFAPRPGA